MATKNNFYTKRIYLVNRDLQLRYTYAAVLVGMVTTILTIIIILYPLYSFEILRIPKFLPLPILISMGFASMVNILIVGYFGIIITHRIAGPVYALVKGFRKVDNRNLILMKLKNLESRVQGRLKNGSFVGLVEDELKEIK